MRRGGSTIAIAAIAFGAFAGVARGTDGSRQTAKLKFTSHRPAAVTGVKLRVDYVNPDDSQAKPPAVRKVVQTYARGARIDTSAPALCTASDAELMLLGTATCPDASRVGGGELTLDTGLPGPARYLASPVDFLNNTGELIFLNRLPLGDTPRVVLRSQVDRRRITSDAPFLPGSPPDGAAVDTVRVGLDAIARRRDGERRLYVRTPRRCPDRGFWVNRIAFTYYDGVTQTVKSHSRCEG